MSARVEKEFRKFPPQIRTVLVTKTLKLAEDPQLGEPLKGQFRAFRSFHIKLKNTQYRVVYEVIEPQQKIYVHAIGKRENFYTQLERMNLKSAKAA
jgi:addiction module RelE/StbE family toxin